MEASLDTNVIIHLYKAGYQTILFRRFEKLKVYDYIRYHEMDNHADPEIIGQFDKDVEIGKIELITDEYLREIGMFIVFQQHVKDIRILFDGGDLGEVYAIVIAKTLGCISLVTDDIKPRGPHYTLMRIPDSDVMPFAFYEILFLDYLEEEITEKKFLDCYNTICELSDLSWNCSSKLKGFIRRFWTSPYSDSEKEWMKNFCNDKNINAKQKLQKLSTYITT